MGEENVALDEFAGVVDPFENDEFAGVVDPFENDEQDGDILSTVSQKIDDPIADQESLEKVKTVKYLQQKGYDADIDTVDSWRDTLFTNTSSYGAINQQLTNELSVKPTGETKKVAKKKAWRLVPAATARYTYGGVAGIAGIAQKLIRDYGDENSMAYDVMGEWRKELTKTGEESASIWDGGVPEEVKTSVGGNILSGIGQLFTLPMYAVPGVGPAMTVGQVYDEGLKESDGDHDIAAMYTVASAPLEIVSSLVTMGIGKGIAKVGTKTSVKKVASVILRGQAAGVVEGGEEAAQSAMLQEMVSGKVDLQQVATESLVGYIVGMAGGTMTTSAQAYDSLVEAGVKPDTAKIITDNVNYEDGVKVDSSGTPLQNQGGGNFILTPENTPMVEDAIADAAIDVSDAIESVELIEPEAETITGIDDGPLTTDDIATLRKQPDVIENLDPSPEAELLKKAVNEGDKAALAEYNQGVVGVEDAEAPATPPPLPETKETVSLRRSIENEWREQNDQDPLKDPDYISQQESIDMALDLEMQNKTDEYINKANSGTPLDHTEVAAMLIRKTQMVNEIDGIRDQMQAATASELPALITELDSKMAATTRLTDAIKTGATENARALAMMASGMDKKTFDFVSVMTTAVAIKGKELTPNEQESLGEKVDKLNELDKELESDKQSAKDKKVAEERDELIDQVERAHRIIKDPKTKTVDKNAEAKTLLKRQDKIFELIDEINNGKPKGQKIKKVEKPDSAGYLDMINNLKEEIRAKKEADSDAIKKQKLVDKRDAVLAEIENMHRDIKEKADKLEKGDVEKETDLYKEARRDQDTIASLLEQIRGDVTSKDAVSKEDVYGYKQTIQELRKQLSDKEVGKKLEAEITALEKSLEEDVFPEPTKKSVKSDANEVLKRRKSDLKKEVTKRKERLRTIDEVEKLHRRIKKTNEAGKDSNADVKLIKNRQDKIIKMTNEINGRLDADKQIAVVEIEDSEGYLEMLNNIKEELKVVREERKLDAQIAEMEADIESGNIEKYAKKPAEIKEADALSEKRGRKLDLQKEINRELAALKPKTTGYYVKGVVDAFRNWAFSGDFGHIMRQGAFAFNDPQMWIEGRNQDFIKKSFQAFSKKNADEIDAAILNSENAPLYEQSGLPLIKEGNQLDAREEILVNGILSKMEVLGIRPFAWTENFGRVQITGLNVLRASLFDSFLAQNPEATLSEMKEVSTAIGVLSGRGTIKFGDATPYLNIVFSSPSFTVSRYQAPFILAMKGDKGERMWNNKPLRNRVLQQYASFIGLRTALMWAVGAGLEKLIDDRAWVSTNPKHWAFGRLIAETESGKYRVYDSSGGMLSAFTPLARMTRIGNTLGGLLGNRMSPFISMAEQLIKGKRTFGGEEIGRMRTLGEALMPLNVRGLIESIEEETGFVDATAAFIMDTMGVNSTLVPADKVRDSKWSMRNVGSVAGSGAFVK